MNKLDFEKIGGLIPVIIQDFNSDEVLMLGFMNEEALGITMREKVVTFYSRTKKHLWKKGETSGNFLEVVSINRDCDEDTLLIKVNPQGPTCHKGSKTCFGEGKFGIKALFSLINQRKKMKPKNSYTTSLFEGGIESILAKIDEESAEVVVAARGEGKARLIEESCDLMYHLFVLLVNEGVAVEEIEEELERRNGRRTSSSSH
ncbi:MAG: bifunctional phosphoribosyl-AMP cyclohydrolase/phosphoribosyl-ATP diphosphatase HisIE [bacterium]|nr:bifunctional phosphoribosyl-AMP cyclohydrolase/phosphoribosyl-ATP diphosphatase HisIE [bacterium]